MRALVTGGAGFIGSHTVDALLAADWRVRMLDHRPEPGRPRGRAAGRLHPAADLVRADVRDADALLEALRGCQAVIHLADCPAPAPAFSQLVDLNVTAPALLLELIVRERLPVRKVVLGSSLTVAGEGSYRDAAGRPLWPGPRTQEQLERGEWEIQPGRGNRGLADSAPATRGRFRSPLYWQPTDEREAHPQTPAAMSKVLAERMALFLGRRYGIPTVVLRYALVQGARQGPPSAWNSSGRSFCLGAYLGREPVLHEDGAQVRDCVDVRDVADAHLLVLHDARADFQILNVGSGRPVTVSALARAAAEVFGRRDWELRPSGRHRPGDRRHLCADSRKLQALGWRPRRTLYDSLDAAKAWLIDTGVPEGAALPAAPHWSLCERTPCPATTF